MTEHEPRLPQLGGGLFLTDGGIETTLIFQHGLDLPCDAACVLLESAAGRRELVRYFERYLDIAAAHRTGFILESPTWRANPDWAGRIGTSLQELAAINREAIALMTRLKDRYADRISPIVISGCVGPRSDAYRPDGIMTEREAERYHGWQIGIFAQAGTDMVTAITMTNVPEAIGIVRAARRSGLPVAIAFTVETDGTLPAGPALGEAIEQVDDATAGAPAYYMINCAHPSHFASALSDDAGWTRRVRGLRANASRKSHAELDGSPVLDAGDPQELGADYRALLERFPQINVLGGCCGTDHRHVEQIARACCQPVQTGLRITA